jgi:hypothetical protein
MRFALLALFFCAATASADTVVVARRPVVVTGGAQDYAVVLARRGTLVHSGCGQYEGIACGSTPESARRNCCFYRDALAGRRVIVDEGVAYSPARRQWFAVIRYR